MTPHSATPGPVGQQDTAMPTEKSDNLKSEKDSVIDLTNVTKVDTDIDNGTTEELDLYSPFPPHPNAPEEKNPLTLRAVLIGWSLGSLVNASNVYLGLKAGITNDANMFSTLIGFLALNLFLRMGIPLLRGPYGPLEHNIIQTVATSTGGLSAMFTGSVPAMYVLGLLSDNPAIDYWKLVTLTASGALFGSCAAIAFRRFFVVEAARSLQLVFPTAAAIATIIRDLHLNGDDPKILRSARVLGITLAASLVWVVASSYAKGILYDWHITWWFYAWGGYANRAIYAVNWGFVTIEWAPAFIGYGLLIGLHLSVSWLAGYVAGYGVIGPILVAKGVAQGIAYSPDYPDLVTYFSSVSADPINAPSPRYWLMWPAVAMLISSSLTDVAWHWRTIGLTVRFLGQGMSETASNGLSKLGLRRLSEAVKRERNDSPSESRDPSPPEHQVKPWEWMLGALLSAGLACGILGGHWHINVGIVVLVLCIGMLFAVLVVICTGQSSITPLSAVSSSSQIVVGGILRNDPAPMNSRLLSSLVSGAVASSAAQQVVEMTTDFKIGLFLGTPPRTQWFGQLLGCVPAIFLSPALCILFLRAYPCVIDLTQAATCTFSAPHVASYRVIVTGMLSPTIPISRSSWIFAICAAVTTSIVHITRNWAQDKGYHKLRLCLPNMMMAALGILVPSFSLPFAFVMGAIAARIWKWRDSKSHAALCFAIAAGMIGGESLGGVVNSILNLAEVSGPTYYGTTIGCPGGNC